MGEQRDRAMALAALVEAFGLKDMTPVRIRAYDDALQGVPVPLLNAAVRLAIDTRTFFPKVAELKQDAEVCRQKVIAAHPYQPCDQCARTGWDTVLVEGISRVTRCWCWKAHLQKLAELGVTKDPLALLEPARELTQVADGE